MPEMLDQLYCSQQIVIPPKFPYILKRYCKAAIKTQPYDLLRWSFEYFKALSEHRPPPVKLRLEYPVYSTEGGLTRGCLKVLANQLAGQDIIPLTTARQAWQGFCLDPEELSRIFCLCEVYNRADCVAYVHLIAVAAGMLTKSLTHTMILLCETLTKEPDGGSAAIPVDIFLDMYAFLARMDASKDVRYINGFREGFAPHPVFEGSEEEEGEEEEISSEREKLRGLSGPKLEGADVSRTGEPPELLGEEEDNGWDVLDPFSIATSEKTDTGEETMTEKQKIKKYVEDSYEERDDRRADLEDTVADLEVIVERFKNANYDLGMVAGRQMSITSGEFVVKTIEKEIMDYIDEQIAVLPDPSLKKRKATKEEVAMVRSILESFLDENMDKIIPEYEEIEEEEEPIPDIITVYAVPGIGPPVDEETVRDFEDYALDVTKVQADMIMPRNLRHFMCPPLEKYDEYQYKDQDEDERRKPAEEGTPYGGGTIAD